MWNKIKDNWNLIATILVICFIFLWGKSCGRKEFTPQPTETVTITRYRDTIFPVDTFIVYKLKPGKPIHDTIEKPIYLDSSACNKVYVYNDTVKTKEYEVYTKADVQGLLRNLKLGVKLKVPLIIKDSVVIKKDSLIYRPNKYEIGVGGVIGLYLMAPTINLSIDKFTYTLGYDLYNKQPLIALKYRLIGWTPKRRK